MISIVCPSCDRTFSLAANGARAECSCGREIATTDGIVDLLSGQAEDRQTEEHYTLQWGTDLGFSKFLTGNEEALRHTVSRHLGWPALFEHVRRESTLGAYAVYDAACGYGGVFEELVRDPVPAGIRYVGADIHRSLGRIERPAGADAERCVFVRWDISNPLPFAERFDAIICRAAIHHTPDPPRTFASLVRSLQSGGLIAISAYAKKARVRELADDGLRAAIAPMPADDALGLAREFTRLGRYLQQVSGVVEVAEDLEFLGIPRGEYQVHDLIYRHLLKCWYNSEFGEDYSDVVNYDWYHPTYAYRYERSELEGWFENSGLRVTKSLSNPYQHYVEGVLD